jgi:hypothetical protein
LASNAENTPCAQSDGCPLKLLQPASGTHWLSPAPVHDARKFTLPPVCTPLPPGIFEHGGD